MSAGLEERATRLVEQMEALTDALPTGWTGDDVERLVEARSEVVEAVCALALRDLTPDARQALRARVERVLERDRVLVTELAGRRELIREELARVARARRVAVAQSAPVVSTARRVA